MPFDTSTLPAEELDEYREMFKYVDMVSASANVTVMKMRMMISDVTWQDGSGEIGIEVSKP